MQSNSKRSLSTAQQAARREAPRLRQLAAADLFAVLELRTQHFNRAALSRNFEALRRYVRDFADLAGHVGKTTEQRLASIENLELLCVERGPRARRGVAPP